MSKIIKSISKFMDDLAAAKINTKREFMKWVKSDFNGNGISDYLEPDQ